jgi:uncharacterized protein YdhG (YjbR/CyaY superfamily)
MNAKVAKKTSKPAKAGTGPAAAGTAWTGEELAAMKEHNKELKTAARRGDAAAEGEADVLAKIAEMSKDSRAMAERIHAVVKEHAPGLTSRTWYGMPAYARDGKVVCFFRPAEKFKGRYATLGFEDAANLDDGSMWPVAYALTKLTDADEATIAALVKRAAS